MSIRSQGSPGPDDLARGRDGAWAALIVGLALGPTACTSSASRETIEIDESSVVATNLRVNLAVRGADHRLALREGRAREEGGGFMSAVEARLTHLSDDASQTLAAGANLELDRLTFTGPGVVDYDFDVIAITAGWRLGRSFPTGIAIEGLFGLSYHAIDFDAEFMGVVDSETIRSAGPMIGVQVGWHSPSRVLLYGRASGSFELSGEFDEPESVVLEVGLAYQLGKHLDLGCAWREWRYEGDGSRGSSSDIDLEVSGPLFFLG